MKLSLSARTSIECPLSPTSIHRVYYSARHAAPARRSALGAQRCRDCGLDVYYIDGAWRTPPAGEVVIGLMAEFQERVLYGDPNRVGEPVGIFGAAPAPDHDRRMTALRLSRESVFTFDECRAAVDHAEGDEGLARAMLRTRQALGVDPSVIRGILS